MLQKISTDIFQHLSKDAGKRTLNNQTFQLDPDETKPLWQLLGLKSAHGIEKKIVPGVQPYIIEENIPYIEHLVTPLAEESITDTMDFQVAFRIFSNDFSFVELNAIARRVRSLMLVKKKALWNACPPAGRYNEPFTVMADTGNTATMMDGIYVRIIVFKSRTGPQVDLIDRAK